MARRKNGNIKSPRRVPQWFLANCVRTADELKNSQTRIAISCDSPDTQSKGTTRTSSNSYMVNSSVYQGILDHFPAHPLATKQGTSCHGSETSLSQPEALVLKLPGQDVGGQGFFRAIVESIAQNIDAALISLDIDDLRDLAEHFCKNELDKCGEAGKDYLEICFRDMSHEDDLSRDLSIFSGELLISEPQNASSDEFGDGELALQDFWLMIAFQQQNSMSGTQVDDDEFPGPITLGDCLGDISSAATQGPNAMSKARSSGEDPVTDQTAYEEDHSRGSIRRPHEGGEAIETNCATSVEANQEMPLSTYPEASLSDDDRYRCAISQDNHSDILFDAVLNSGNSKTVKATRQTPGRKQLPGTRVGLEGPSITILLLIEIDKFISVRPWAQIADALRKAVERARDTKGTVIVIMTYHDRNLGNSVFTGCDCASCRSGSATGKVDSMVSKLTQSPAKTAVQVFPIRSRAQEKLFNECHTECTVRTNIRQLKRSLRKMIKPRAVAIAQPYKEWDVPQPVLLRHLGDSQLSTQSIDQLAKLMAGDLEIERAFQKLEQDAERAEALSQWMNTEEQSRALRKSSLSRDLQSLIEKIRQDKKASKEELKLLDCVVNPDDIQTTWEDIELDVEIRSRITQMVSLTGQNPPCSGILGRRQIGGALLYGPPGTGKTHVARVIAKSSSATMLQVSAAQIESQWVGETEKMIHALFQLGKRLAPCIIFIDEADALFYSREFSTRSWEFGRVNQLLGQADGLTRDTTGPFLLLATNYPHKLDHAVLRRVPARFYLGLPTLNARERIFKILLKDDPLEPDVDIRSLAKATSEYSGSDIEFVCQQAATVALSELQTSEGWQQTTQRGLSMANFQKALTVSSPTNSEAIISKLAEFAADFDRPALAKINGAKCPSSETSGQPGGLPQPHTLQKGDAKLGSQVTSQTNLTACEVTGDRSLVSPPQDTQDSDMSVCVDKSLSLPLYLPLDKSRQEIRLLEIIKDGSNETQVECTLHTVALTNDVSFTALSYVWGDPNMRRDILVNKQVMSVTISLEHSLRWARYHWQKKYPEREANEFRLWADAVCINQADVEEKNHQVPVMGKIYSVAELTLGAVAVDDSAVCEGLKIYSQIYDVLTEGQLRLTELKDCTWLRRIPALCCDNTSVDEFPHNSAWHGLMDLLNRPYWQRVWILQEICLSKQLQLICAGESLDFDKILKTVKIGSLVFLKREDFNRRPDFISERNWCSKCCFDVLANTHRWEVVLRFRSREKPEPWPGLIPLGIQCCQVLQATDMRDYVYGLQGLTKTKIPIDYRKSVEEVYIDFLNAQIRIPHSEFCDCGVTAPGNCQFLAYAGARTKKISDTAPSWVPNLAAFANQDPVTGQQNASVNYAQSTTVLRVAHTEAIEARISGSSLHVSGVRIGEVKTTVKPILELEVTSEVHGDLRWSQEMMNLIRDKVLQDKVEPGEKTALEAILRSLAGHPRRTGREVIMSLFRTFLAIVGYDLDPNAASRHAQKIAQILDPQFGVAFNPEDQEEVFDWFIRNVFPGEEPLYDQQEVAECWNRMDLRAHSIGLLRNNILECMFETEQGIIGTGPSDIETGDILCVFYLCNRPMVLRQVDDHLVHIGSCWVPELCGVVIHAEHGKLGQDVEYELERFEIR